MPYLNIAECRRC